MENKRFNIWAACLYWIMFDEQIHTPIVRISDKLTKKAGIDLYLKREDLTHPYISGNKFRKLKYNLLEARKLGHKTLLTFGGAYSNHVHALAFAGKKYHFNTIGVIRGELSLPLNPTLENARDFGMRFHFVTRNQYREKTDASFLNELREIFGDFLVIPEGGTNFLAVKGCTEMVSKEVKSFNYVCCAVGTGGTISGIISGMEGNQKVIGFPVLKGGEFLEKEIEGLITASNTGPFHNWSLECSYHFGGYAKFNKQLIDFINWFKEQHNIPLDPVYIGKMMYGLYDLIARDYFKQGERILAIHTGGLQGITGFNQRFKNIIDV